MQETPHAVNVADGKPGDVVAQTPHSTCRLLDVAEAPPRGVDVVVTLADGRRLGYAPSMPGPDAGGEVVPDALLRGNAFVPVHESPRSLAAMLSIAASRRVETGPESERVLVIVRGGGLVFLQNEETLRFDVGTLVVLPAGEPARVWAQGPDDVLAVVLQPRAAPSSRRTLASEVARRRQGEP